MTESLGILHGNFLPDGYSDVGDIFSMFVPGANVQYVSVIKIEKTSSQNLKHVTNSLRLQHPSSKLM